MMNFSITMTDNATPRLQALLATLTNPRPVLDAAARGLARTLRDHFRSRDGTPTKQGWPSSGIWGDIAAGTAVRDVTNDEATVAVVHPAIRQKVYGGEITPKRGTYLALPANAAAYKAGSPREGGAPQSLAFVYSLHPQGGWRPSLVVEKRVEKEVGKPRKDGTRRRKVVAEIGEIWYWLIRKAYVPADPAALPAGDVSAEAAVLAALEYLNTSTGARSQAA